LFDLNSGGGNLAVSRADSAMHRASVFAGVGVACVVGFFLVVGLTRRSSIGDTPACGLFLAALATVVLPIAAAAFCGGLTLCVAAMVQRRELLSPLNVAVITINVVGAAIFGYFLFWMFFGQFLLT
jgi:hypothetical protein